ncbi:MAG: hypothetical protein K0S70_2337, partial [Microbacterium sp.]|nr:hypothetical protein [Microbacterium sp.]
MYTDLSSCPCRRVSIVKRCQRFSDFRKVIVLLATTPYQPFSWKVSQMPLRTSRSNRPRSNSEAYR